MGVRASGVTDGRAAAFVAACLAPLPPGSAPARRPALEREAKQELRGRWHRAWLEVEFLEREMEAARYGRMLAGATGQATALCEHGWRADLRAAVGRLMLVPAPRKDDLAFKRRHLRWAEEKAAAERAIAADGARLAAARRSARGTA